METGIEIIAEECEKQISLGYTLEHDANSYALGQLANAAIAIMARDENGFPKGFSPDYINKLINKRVQERLAIAGAWIARELERHPKLKK